MRLLALALAICALAACGDTTPDEAPAKTTPAPEQQPPPCEVEQLEDGSVKIQCGDGDPVVLEAGEPGMDGEDGVDGQDGTSCEVVERNDSRFFLCEDGSTASIWEPDKGDKGENGEDGKDGKGMLVQVTREPAGMNCPEGGLKIETGFDEDGDGVLSGPERSNADTSYVCDQLSTDTPLQIAAGWSHTCAMLEEEFKCWGSAYYGELGGGVPNNRVRSFSPTPVVDFPGKPSQVSAGYHHTCAISQSGDVYCWGSNIDGSLGITTDHWETYKPTSRVPLPSAAKQLASGDRTSCALTVAGRLWCWGHRANSQAPPPERLNEIPLPFAPTTFDTSGRHTCAISPVGEVWCWGANASGQLGHGDLVDRENPTQPTPLPAAAVQVQTGWAHTCALLDNGEVYCWGSALNGQLGDGYTTPQSTPQDIGLGRPVKATHIATGWSYTCVAFEDDTVECKGDDVRPRNRLFAEGIVQLASGNRHMCLLDGAGQVWCTGDNYNGQLGITQSSSSYYNRVLGL